MTTKSADPIRVVVIDRSGARHRRDMVDALQADGDISVVGDASVSADAVDLVNRSRPHVVAVDLGIGDGGGQYVIEQIMAELPTPIVVLSGSSDQRSGPAANALVGGALLALQRPDHWTPKAASELRSSIRSLRDARVIRHPRARLRARGAAPARKPSGSSAVVAMAASTGGPAALATVLAGLGGLGLPVLVVQHLHAEFVAGLAVSLGRSSALPIEIAEHGATPKPGHVYLAPGDVHLRLDAASRIELSATPVSLHRPSADVLFDSVAENAGAAGIGVLLTGMGEDGARGLTAMRRQGAHTVAQDELSCAVFGMPRAAYRLGAVDRLVPLANIAAAVLRAAEAVAT